MTESKEIEKFKRKLFIEKQINYAKASIEEVLNLDDLSKNTREQEYVLGRLWLYKILHSTLFLSHRLCGEKVGRKSSNVTIALQKFDDTLRDYPNFRGSYNQNNYSIVKGIKDAQFLNKTLSSKETLEIKNKNIELSNENLRLIEKVNSFKDISETCKKLSPEKMKELLDYRIKPFVKINS